MFFLFPVVSGRSSSCSFFLFFLGFFITEHVYLTQASNGHLGPSATPRTRPATRRKRPSNIKKKNEEQQQQHLEARPKKSNKKTQRWKQKKKNETGGTTKIKPKKKDKKNVHCFFLYFRVFFVVVVGGQLVEYARGTPSPSRFHPKLEKPMLRPFAVALNASAAANSFFF